MILRSGPTGGDGADQHIPENYLALDYGPHGGGHGHPDKLGFVLYGRGTLLAEDPGCIAYGNPAQVHGFACTCGRKMHVHTRTRKTVLMRCFQCGTERRIPTADYERMEPDDEA